MVNFFLEYKNFYKLGRGSCDFLISVHLFLYFEHILSFSLDS